MRLPQVSSESEREWKFKRFDYYLGSMAVKWRTQYNVTNTTIHCFIMLH